MVFVLVAVGMFAAFGCGRAVAPPSVPAAGESSMPRPHIVDRAPRTNSFSGNLDG